MTKRAKFSFVPFVPSLAFLFLIGASSAETIPEDFIDGLKSEDFKVREAAQADVIEWAGKQTETRVHLLLEQARNAPDPEVRQRCHNVLYALAMEEYLQDGEGFVGIQMNGVRAQVPGEDVPRQVILITRVLPDTPAREAGLLAGDMIVSVNGEKPAHDDALTSFHHTIRGLKPGEKTRFEVIRDGDSMEVELALGRRPPEHQGRLFNQPMMNLNELAKQDQDRFFKEWLEKLEN